jgi:glycogen debranching enzyme
VQNVTKLLNEMYERAVQVLRENSTPFGLRASATYYSQIWARDVFISSLGADLLDDQVVLKGVERSVHTLAKTRSPLGQIADCYNTVQKRAEFGVSGATDASCWYVIGLADLYKTLRAKWLMTEPLDAAIAAYKWLRHQDANNTWLIDSPQGADWMDAALRRTGKTLYNNILFLIATRAINKLCEVSKKRLEQAYRLDESQLESRFLQVFHSSESTWSDIEAYWPQYAEKMGGKSFGYLDFFVHFISFTLVDTHFDTLSNLLCVLSGVGDEKFLARIMSYVESRRLSRPYPVKVLDPPYAEGASVFDAEFNTSLPSWHRSEPYSYQNGAVWPFVGGFYVMALIESGSPLADRELGRLAEANNMKSPEDKFGFNEWLHGRTGEPLGQDGQTWNAGTFIAACLYKKGVNRFQYE